MMSDVAVALSSSLAWSVVVKSAIILGLALLAVWMAPGARASVRHVILAATFGALLALPVLAMVTPSIPIAVASVRAPVVAAGTASGVAFPESVPKVKLGDVLNQPWTLPRLVHAVQNWSRIDWSLSIGVAWACGSLVMLATLAAGIIRARRLRRTGVPSLELHALAHRHAREAGVTRDVAVMLHERAASPLTCGSLRPAIVLPFGIETWTAENIRHALVHELEHVRRYDATVQIAARAVCAVYWFNPLVWIAFRRLCLEAERACDDAVVRISEPTGYAEQLVLLARECAGGSTSMTLAMARRSELSARVSALLDAHRPRGRAGFLAVGAATIVAAAVVMALAPLHAVAATSANAATGMTELQLGSSSLDRALYRASERGDLERMRQLLDAGARVDAALSGDGSPLIAAAREGRLAAVGLLLDRGADPNMPVPGDGNPLIMAAREGHVDVVTLLLDRGAHVNQLVPDDENALIQASAEGHVAVVRLLVSRGADVHTRVWIERASERPNGEWRSALSMARKGRHDAVIEFLVSAGARE